MTEFRRASSAVEAVEKLVAELAGDAAAVTATAEPSQEMRGRWAEVQRQLGELAPTAEKMQRRCKARAELEALKVEVQALLPGQPAESLKVAQEIVDAKGEGFEALMPFLAKAVELEAVATYGVNMAAKVGDLLVRLEAAKKKLEEEVAPHLSSVVAKLDADEAARLAQEKKEAEAAAAAEAQRQAEELKRPLVELMQANQERLDAQREAEEAEKRKLEAEEAARKEAEEARIEEEEMLMRAEQDTERRLVEVGPEETCAEALVSMLTASVGDYRAVVEGLQHMLASIASEPQEPRLRVIRIANEGFQEKLGRRPGVWTFLRGIGFENLTRESLPPGLPAAVGMPPGPPTERFLLLQEPDMMNKYEEWTAWHNRINQVAKFLQGLERVVFQRTAHLGRHGLDVKAKDVMKDKEIVQGWMGAVSESG